jgi:hypothetical protein
VREALESNQENHPLRLNPQAPARGLSKENIMQLDLVDEMQWEDVVEFETLEEAGLEESTLDEPVHGQYLSCEGSIYSYTDWFYDNDSSAFSTL